MSATPLTDVRLCNACHKPFVEHDKVIIVLATYARTYIDSDGSTQLAAEMDWDAEFHYHLDCYAKTRHHNQVSN
jgi:hypothetical protein